ncbi:hypothetical protein CK203_073060 [Vitis vinifera]|uniref:Uncharacterized protein n=1 Tax=Vitis vinifera TaxID=29760 RepID=A0A438BZ33_VITVI|nr:hypothetical protein CK203_073060 [Vitis vinifera]
MEPLYLRLWKNLFQRAQHLFILLITYLLQEQIPPNSFHAILSFIVAVLASFLAAKYAGKVTSPFETHPKTMQFAIGSLLVYCLAYGAQQKFLLLFTHQLTSMPFVDAWSSPVLYQWRLWHHSFFRIQCSGCFLCCVPFFGWVGCSTLYSKCCGNGSIK